MNDTWQNVLDNVWFYGTIFLITYLTIRIIWALYQNFLIRKMGETAVLLEVVLEKDTEKDPFSIEQFWSSFHGLYLPWYKRLTKPQPYITFEIKSEHDVAKKKKEITFNFWVPEQYKPFVKQRILGLYPNAQINELNIEKQDYFPDENDRMRVIETAEVGLAEDSAFTLKTFKDFASDPLGTITAAMTELDKKEIAVVQVVARPHNPKWRKRASRVLERYEKTGKKPSKLPEWTNHFQAFLGIFFKMFEGFVHGLSGGRPPDDFRFSSSSLDKEKQKEMFEKAIRNPFAFQVRILVGSPFGSDAAKQRMESILSSFKELEGSNNRLKKEMILNKKRIYTRMKKRYFSSYNNDDILSTVELASFAHLPNKDIFTPGLKKIQSKQAENPVDVAKDNAFALANFRGETKPIGLDQNARMRHVYITGMTGVGKSVLQENMIINDIESGELLAVQ